MLLPPLSRIRTPYHIWPLSAIRHPLVLDYARTAFLLSNTAYTTILQILALGLLLLERAQAILHAAHPAEVNRHHIRYLPRARHSGCL